MTPKERLDKLVKYVSVAIDGRWDLLTEDTKYPLMQTEEYKGLVDCLTELEELKRYPTSEEVCEALSEYWGNQVRYDERHSLFEMYVGDNTWKPVELLRMRTEKPSIITLIGRFYEGMEKKDV